ncbi:MAG: class IIb bacteriocin, lactobin A/cerein 7B family [Paeniclostridium sordellii]|uniref:Class IIb bacteriocin, lactobin A/cerein 7B family n=1 Tax=Paeniclostridium hominis TaxID=2764329 RepID=A0ABR7K7Z8_9FIRM|nr:MULTISPECIES: class IIb bacteriocin, lactobin A/cerein 7B family [Paeniclostridium]MBC6005015.1 class IIb bacteriocin, lactobin A/cerein 7B family [Paeniclostridium hominis]MDU2592190.1 class IIb bacteriocin, lactobin A/cerein 7B family [Paeniclostridium sordellii]
MNELNFEDLQEVNGGGAPEAINALVGTIGLAGTPFILPAGPQAVWDHISTNWDMISDASKNAYRKRKRR